MAQADQTSIRGTLRALSALLVTSLACAHATGQVPRPTPAEVVAPEPDFGSMREVTARAPTRYVSALAYRHYVAALLAKGQGALPLAVAELREALLFDPESPHLHALLADTLFRMGSAGPAEDELKIALSLDPGHGPARLLAAQIALAAHRDDDARAQLVAAIEADPSDADALRELVRLEVAKGRLREAQAAAQSLAASARKALEQAAAARRVEEAGVLARDLRGADWQAHRAQLLAAEAFVELARAHAAERDDTAASDEFAHASVLAPSEEVVLAAHAAFLESRRRVPEARELQLRILARRPDAPEAMAALGRLALQAGDPEGAQAYAAHLRVLASELLAEGSGREDDRRELAQALFRLGIPLLGAHRGRESLALFESALDLVPGNAALTFYRAVALARTGSAAEAATLFEQLAAQPAGTGGGFLDVDRSALLLDAQVQAALSRARAGQLDEALTRLRELLGKSPTEETVGVALIEAYERAGRMRDAVGLLARAADDNPKSPGALFALGSAQDRLGDREAALGSMKKVLELDPQHAGALNFVGYSLTLRGTPEDLKAAEPLLRRAAALRSDDGAIADSLGLCLMRLGQVDDALGELARADQLSPDDPVILGHLGDALLAAGRRDDAKAAFKRALRDLSPRPPATRSASERASSPRPEGERRLPEATDAHVRDELEAKLRSLTAR